MRRSKRRLRDRVGTGDGIRGLTEHGLSRTPVCRVTPVSGSYSITVIRSIGANAHTAAAVFFDDAVDGDP